MKKLIYLSILGSCIFLSGCNTSLVHKSNDKEWIAEQIEKQDPSKN